LQTLKVWETFTLFAPFKPEGGGLGVNTQEGYLQPKIEAKGAPRKEVKDGSSTQT
jgi:hypothetical protein